MQPVHHGLVMLLLGLASLVVTAFIVGAIP